MFSMARRPEEYDDHSMAAPTPAFDVHGYPVPTAYPPTESKRDRRRREIVDRVEQMRMSSLDRREPLFHNLLTSLHSSHVALLTAPTPVHTNYLFRLHEISIQRDLALSSVRQQSEYHREVARKLYEMEVEAVETEYELAKRGVKERLLDACEERARKLREEKDGVEINLDTMFDASTRPHATRHRNGRGTRGPSYADIHNGVEPRNGIPLPSQESTADPQPFASSILPSSPLLSTGTNPSTSLLNSNALLSTLASLPRTVRAKRQTGVPTIPTNPQPTTHGHPSESLHLTVMPGKYDFMGKSLTALKGMGGDEVGEDLSAIRKRKRGAAQGRKNLAEYY